MGLLKKNVDYINDTIINFFNQKDHKFASKMINKIGNMINNFKGNEEFNLYYHKCLQNRLLNTETNLEIEKIFIKEFKYGYKMFYMTKDIEENKLPQNDSESMYVGIKTLRPQIWNLSENKHKYIVPKSIEPHIKEYEKNYQEKYPARKLKWNFNWGEATIKIKIKENVEYTLNVSCPLLFVLMQFGNGPVSAREISRGVGLQLTDLSRFLNELLKIKLIKVVGDANNDNPDIVLDINDNFTSENDKISLLYL